MSKYHKPAWQMTYDEWKTSRDEKITYDQKRFIFYCDGWNMSIFANSPREAILRFREYCNIPFRLVQT